MTFKNKRKIVKVAMDIDDVHPRKGFGIDDINDNLRYARLLNKNFGMKFTLFIPTNCFGEYPISKYKDWFENIINKDYYEVGAHGHYHHRKDKADFAGSQKEVNEIIELMESEFSELGYTPTGVKPCGGLITQGVYGSLSKKFEWISDSVAYKHRKVNSIKRVFCTCSSASPQYKGEEEIYIQSHIASGEHISNSIDETYNRVSEFLVTLSKEVDVLPVFVSQLTMVKK